jgi:hypothetical protein
VPLVVFGTGMVGKDLVKLSGLRHGATVVFYRILKKCENEGELLVVPTIDKLKMPRICNICKTGTSDKAFYTHDFGILVCKTCKTLWQRGVNASKNMMSIAFSICNQDGRPITFSRI